MTEENLIPNYKMIVVGDPGTGKSSFIRSHLNGTFSNYYTPSVKTNRQAVRLFSSRGEFILDMWDVSSSESSSEYLPESYYNSDCAVVMFDVSQRRTYKPVYDLCKEIEDQCDRKLPIVLCGNKVDLGYREIRADEVNRLYRKRPNIQYMDISVRTGHQLDFCLLWLIRSLFHDQSLVFLPEPAPPPVEIEINAEDAQALVQALIAANDVPLPEDEDEL